MLYEINIFWTSDHAQVEKWEENDEWKIGSERSTTNKCGLKHIILLGKIMLLILEILTFVFFFYKY